MKYFCMNNREACPRQLLSGKSKELNFLCVRTFPISSSIIIWLYDWYCCHHPPSHFNQGGNQGRERLSKFPRLASEFMFLTIILVCVCVFHMFIETWKVCGFGKDNNTVYFCRVPPNSLLKANKANAQSVS